MIIDTNVYLSRWPWRRVHGDEPQQLVQMLREAGVSEAWTGTLDGVFHKDVAAANERLVQDCHRHGPELLVPFGTVNPSLPDWEDDLRRCHEEFAMPGIRLHPDYHGYPLNARPCERLLRMAAERGRIVQIALRMQDARTLPRFLTLSAVDLAALPALASAVPKLRLILLNMANADLPQLSKLEGKSKVAFDIATLEGAGIVERAVAQCGIERILFGSYAPVFVMKSASLKMQESELSDRQMQAITHGNARRFVAAE